LDTSAKSRRARSTARSEPENSGAIGPRVGNIAPIQIVASLATSSGRAITAQSSDASGTHAPLRQSEGDAAAAHDALVQPCVEGTGGTVGTDGLGVRLRARAPKATAPATATTAKVLPRRVPVTSGGAETGAFVPTDTSVGARASSVGADSSTVLEVLDSCPGATVEGGDSA
jgi:hypothetical protein